jgi:hypothetical protein
MRSTFNPPDDQARRAIGSLYERIRCFDANLRARISGYEQYRPDPGAGELFADPVTDPHGNPWVLLTDADLRDRAQWCMLPEYHRALLAERRRRAEVTR